MYMCTITQVIPPFHVKSRTDFVITVANCLVVLQSKLQTRTALSTMEMEAEVIVMAHSTVLKEGYYNEISLFVWKKYGFTRQCLVPSGRYVVATVISSKQALYSQEVLTKDYSEGNQTVQD
eukprot:CCRYP_018302-RA/>CCRYP_018302-RA protein AED:0.18 eAED:0.58 QI:0/0/0/1/0/0.5/2/0/120